LIAPYTHTSSMFDITDLVQPSFTVPDLNLHASLSCDSSPVLDPVLPVPPVTSNTWDPGYLDTDSQTYVARTEFPWAV